jgi:hypothetical protein
MKNHAAVIEERGGMRPWMETANQIVQPRGRQLQSTLPSSLVNRGA